MKKILSKLLQKKNLSLEEIVSFFSLVEKGHVNEIEIASFCIAMKAKGISSEEIEGACSYFSNPILGEASLDITGMGGKEGKPYNVSVAASFLVASFGVKVAKLFRPALSSCCGSQEILQALGVKNLFDTSFQKACLGETGMGFFSISSALFSAFSSVRKSIRVPTLLDLIAPLLHPISVEKQIIGIPCKKERKALSAYLKEKNFPREIVIIGSEDGFDEVSPFAPTQVTYVKKGEIKETIIFPKDFGLTCKRKSFYKSTLISSEKIRNLLKGEEVEGKEWALVNASFALHFLGKAASFLEGMDLVQKNLTSLKKRELLFSL